MTPGELLKAELTRMGVNRASLARMSGISVQRINDLIVGRVKMSPVYALKIDSGLKSLLLTADDLIMAQSIINAREDEDVLASRRIKHGNA